MNIINSATPRQQSIPSVRCAGEAMFTPSPSSSIAPDYQSLIVTHGENATVLGPSHGVVVKALAVAAIAAGVGTRTQQHKSTKIADQNDAARAFKLRVRPLPRQEFSVELCPNGNRLWCPEHGSLIRRPVVPENPIRCGFAAMAAGPTMAIPTRFFIGLGCDGPS